MVEWFRVPSGVADITQIDRDSILLARIAKEKSRAGGGHPPLGNAIRRPTACGWAEADQTAGP